MIPAAKTKVHVETLFKVLYGDKPVSSAPEILPKSQMLKEYQPEHKLNKWKLCTHWRDWWMKPNYIRKS